MSLNWVPASAAFRGECHHCWVADYTLWSPYALGFSIVVCWFSIKICCIHFTYFLTYIDIVCPIADQLRVTSRAWNSLSISVLAHCIYTDCLLMQTQRILLTTPLFCPTTIIVILIVCIFLKRRDAETEALQVVSVEGVVAAIEQKCLLKACLESHVRTLTGKVFQVTGVA